VVLTVALDRSPDDARPWIEAARPTHPTLIDPAHLLADLYNMVNVPTILWIDERGRIVRPNDVAFGDDRFRSMTGLDATKHLTALRAWVREGVRPFTDEQVRAFQARPSVAQQEARAYFGLGEWLYEQGRAEAAARHFGRAAELAPHDFTIRRGTMRMRGQDPMGPEFREMYREWTQAGRPYYRPLPQ
jgi:tetratricopeptide (TPR) repeat protein